MGRWEDGKVGRAAVQAARRAKKGLATGFEGRFCLKHCAAGQFRRGFLAVLGGGMFTHEEHVQPAFISWPIGGDRRIRPGHPPLNWVLSRPQF
jgi:hypothetical protein